MTISLHVYVVFSGLRKGVRERICLSQTQTYAQRRTQVRVHHVWQSLQETGPSVSKLVVGVYWLLYILSKDSNKMSYVLVSGIKCFFL